MPGTPSRDHFRTTRWSLISETQRTDAAGSRQARLDELCLRYWAPVSLYLGRNGYPAEAIDRLTRAFFHQLLHEGIDRAAGHRRFRTFLLGELQQFLALHPVDTPLPAPLLPPSATRDASPPAVPGAPEQALHRGFALEVISHAMARLRAEAGQAGRVTLFEQLQCYLSSEPAADDYAADARALGARTVFVAMAVRRLRERFRELVDDELAQLVSNADEFAGERAALLQALERTS